MANLPHIDRMQFGILDQNYMNTIAESSEAFAEMKTSLDELVTRENRKYDESFLVQLTNNSPIAETASGERTIDIAWKYNWVRVEVGSFYDPETALTTDINYQCVGMGCSGGNTHTSNDFRAMIGEPNGSASGYAYNLAELSNIATAPIIFGINVSGGNYPTGYSPQPCANGSIVMLTPLTDSLGVTNFRFDRQGAHDGDCETI